VIGCGRSAPAEPLGDGYAHHCLDVADERAVKELFRAIRQQHGRLDVLVNNAGVAGMNHALLTPMSQVERILATNVSGTFLFSREAAKLMQRARSGRIVNVVTVATPLRLAGEAIYAASKAAVESLTRVLAHELGPLGITVNAVGPTPIPTALTAGVPDDKLQALLGRQAIPRAGTVADVANVVDFFLRPESDFITGQVLYLGGIS
jgi:3-oxoacyl-[acyl-carrier protein] reductase